MDKAENILLTISKEYRLAKERQNKVRRSIFDHSRLLEDKTIPYNVYTSEMEYLEIIRSELNHLNTEVNTWDKAREICLHIIGGFDEDCD